MGYNYDGSGASVFGNAPSAYHAMRNHFLYDTQIINTNYLKKIHPTSFNTYETINTSLEVTIDE